MAGTIETFKTQNTIIDTTLNAKYSATYFDRVIPLLLPVEFACADDMPNAKIMSSILVKLLPSEFANNVELFNVMGDLLQGNVDITASNIKS